MSDSSPPPVSSPSTQPAPPELLRALSDIQARLARIEQALEPAVRAREELPRLAATAVDALDEAATGSPDVERRIPALADAVERLTRPQVLDGLNRLVDLAQQLPDVAATTVDILDEAAQATPDVHQRIPALADAVERLTRPDLLQHLRAVVDQGEQLPGLVATVVDIFDEAMLEAAEEGLQLDALFANLRQLTITLVRGIASAEWTALVESGMFTPEALHALGKVARALADVSGQPAPQVGLLGALRALRQPELQRGLGFLIEVGRRFGASLDPTPRLEG